ADGASDPAARHRAQNAERHGHQDTAGIAAGHDQLRDGADDEAEDHPSKYADHTVTLRCRCRAKRMTAASVAEHVEVLQRSSPIEEHDALLARDCSGGGETLNCDEGGAPFRRGADARVSADRAHSV